MNFKGSVSTYFEIMMDLSATVITLLKRTTRLVFFIENLYQLPLFHVKTTKLI